MCLNVWREFRLNLPNFSMVSSLTSALESIHEKRASSLAREGPAPVGPVEALPAVDADLVDNVEA